MIAFSPADLSSSAFDKWAAHYDHEPNPMLALEERTLPALLPRICGADVLDAGCGTGRWLHKLEAHSPNSLAGIDCSSAMLEQARQKLSPRAALHLGDASSLPSRDRSMDVILASFVLSYITDISAFASECARVVRPGGHLLLSDMHPVTAARRNWIRTAQTGDSKFTLPASRHFLPIILTTFAQSGFRLVQLAEPSFGEAERPLFEQAGKLSAYASLQNQSAIYLMKFQRLPNIRRLAPSNAIFENTAPNRPLRKSLQKSHDIQLTNAPWSASATTWNTSSLSIQSGHFSTKAQPQHSLDLEGYVLLPGLINSHDHLEFALFPNLGRPSSEAPFRNSTEWATEIHLRHAGTIAQHLQVPLDTRLWWGAIRNLLSGVTTVCHHNPLHPALTSPGFPIRVLTDIGWAHSLAFDPNLSVRFQSSPSRHPFLLHAAEGTDSQSRDEILTLENLRLLDRHTVIIHGLALSHSSIALLNRRGTAVVLCPTSNRFLFKQTLSPDLLYAIEQKALGSDSPLTATGDLLDEIN